MGRWVVGCGNKRPQRATMRVGRRRKKTMREEKILLDIVHHVCGAGLTSFSRILTAMCVFGISVGATMVTVKTK